MFEFSFASLVYAPLRSVWTCHWHVAPSVIVVRYDLFLRRTDSILMIRIGWIDLRVFYRFKEIFNGIRLKVVFGS